LNDDEDPGSSEVKTDESIVVEDIFVDDEGEAVDDISELDGNGELGITGTLDAIELEITGERDDVKLDIPLELDSTCELNDTELDMNGELEDIELDATGEVGTSEVVVTELKDIELGNG
jgi:hypothetical protein